MENDAGNIFQHPAAEIQDMHCVHIEGKNPSDESPKQTDKETKSLEQGDENDDKGKGEVIQLIPISSRAEEKCKESEVDKTSTTSKESNQKDVSKIEHIGGKKDSIKKSYILGNNNKHKLNETDGQEEFPKCIGDKKRVKFLVEDGKKPWSHNFKHSKNREIRNTSTNKKINDQKRQRLLTDRNRSPQRENLKQKGDLKDTLKNRNMSPERDKPNHLIKNKDKEKVKEKVELAKPQKPECKVIEKTDQDQDQDDSGDDYWSKSNNDSVYHMGILQVTGDSVDISTNRVDSPDGVERDGFVIRKSLSAENKDISVGNKEISKTKKYSSDAALADSRRMQKEEEEEEIIAQSSPQEEHSHEIDTADVITNDGENRSNICESEEGKPSVLDESSGEENRRNNLLEGTSNKFQPRDRSQLRPGRWGARALCCSGWALWAAWVLRLAGVLPPSLPNLVPVLGALLLALLLLHVMWLASLPDAPATAPTASPDAPGGSPQDDSATSLPTTLSALPLQQSTE